MNWATIVFLAVMALGCYLIWRLGGKAERLKQADQYKEDIDVYLKKRNSISLIRESYTDDDIMSGKPLYEDSPPAKADTEPCENFTDRR